MNSVIVALGILSLSVVGISVFGNSDNAATTNVSSKYQAEVVAENVKPADTTATVSEAPQSYNSDEAYEYECNENYEPCVEQSAYDLDCIDIGEMVEVVGYDEYNLDRDGDGYGCESYN